MRLHRFGVLSVFGVVWGVLSASAFADGKVQPRRDYKGSLEEKAQEAIIIFHAGDEPGEATQDMILKISVEGDVEEFAWIVPLPTAPKTYEEDAKLFSELFRYCESRKSRPRSPGGRDDKKSEGEKSGSATDNGVRVISRDVVGKFDVDVVQETEAGKLNEWLTKEGYQPLIDAEDVLEFYRKKQFVFACIKVNDAALKSNRPTDLHPLRFSFKTGGRDGIYFPMKLTGLQEESFDVNLYVFYRFWLNDKLNRFGYTNRGFRLDYRDWDSRACVPDGGKAWSNPKSDPFLRSYAHMVPTVTKLMQKLHPGEKYYLTKIQAYNLKPRQVRQWSDDLWLFPFYRGDFTPYDAREGGVASASWKGLQVSNDNGNFLNIPESSRGMVRVLVATILGILLCCGLWFGFEAWKLRQARLEGLGEKTLADDVPDYSFGDE